MRFTKGFALLALGLLLLMGLTACPQVVVGWIDLDVNARTPSRCDNGIKVVLEIKEGAIVDLDYSIAETDLIYGSGNYWVWVKPGKRFEALFETTRAFDQNAENETFTVKAYCIRKNADSGMSERTFDAGMFLTKAGVVSALIEVSDSGADPDYTVTPPGMVISKPRD